jgi:hypothetical protein
LGRVRKQKKQKKGKKALLSRLDRLSTGNAEPHHLPTPRKVVDTGCFGSFITARHLFKERKL